MNMRLPGNGVPVAWLLGAGFAVRAIDQVGVIDVSTLRQAVAESTTLLYCLGFGYALQSVFSGGYSPRLHLGATCLIAGAVLHALVGSAPIGLGLSVAGAGLLAMAMWQAAGRAQPGFQRLAVLVSVAGPALFALHTAIFPAGADLLSARLLRLGGTAAMALPLLATLYRLNHTGEATRATRFARALLGIGMVAMPLVLLLSAFVDNRLKYGLAPASDCIAVALIIACLQAWRRDDNPALAGFGTLLVSMALGKLMGFYAFDGPLPAPAALAAYGDPWRIALRDFHIDLMVLGYAFLLWPSLVRPLVIVVAGLALALGVSMPAMGIWSGLAGVATLLWVVMFWRGKAVA